MVVLITLKDIKLCRLIAKINTRFQPDAPRWCNKNDMWAGGHQPRQSIVVWQDVSETALSTIDAPKGTFCREGQRSSGLTVALTVAYFFCFERKPPRHLPEGR